jgi:hypothetical protein
MGKNSYETLIQVFENRFKFDLLKKTRHAPYVYARMIFFKILREDFGLKLEDISKLTGKHHATVIHHIRKYHDYASYDKSIVKDYENIKFDFDVARKTEYTVKDVYKLVSMVESLKRENDELKSKTDTRMFRMIETIHPDAEPNIYYRLEAIVKMNNIVDKK